MEIWQSTVSIIAVIVGAVVWITSRFSKVDRRIHKVDHRIDAVRDGLGEAISVMGNSLSAILNIQETVVTILAKANLIKAEEQIELYKNLASAHVGSIARAVDSIRRAGNPFSPEEVQRLEHYTDKLIRGQRFTSDEVMDFHALAHKLKKERPEQEGTWYLVALAAFLLGMHAGSKE